MCRRHTCRVAEGEASAPGSPALPARGYVSSSFAAEEVPHSSEVTGLPPEFTKPGQGQGSGVSCFGVDFLQRGAGGLSQSPQLLGSLAMVLKLPENCGPP